MPSLFIPVATMGKCKQIKNPNLQYVSDVISLIIHEKITRFHRCHASHLKQIVDFISIYFL